MTAQSLLSQRLKLNGDIFLDMNREYLKRIFMKNIEEQKIAKDIRDIY